MTSCVHVCFTSHNEVMFRNKSDYIFGIFAMVFAAIRTGSAILAFALMSDHVHVIILSSSYSSFVTLFRQSYDKHFNKKYGRVGRLGEKTFYHLDLSGANHILAAITYVLRNAVHHGIMKSPYEYEFASTSCYFNKFFARKSFIVPTSMSLREMNRLGLICRKSVAECGGKIHFDSDGKILYEDFVDIPFVESHYVTGRRFSYFMTRFSEEEWDKIQMQDISGTNMNEEEYRVVNPPIKISDLEPSFNLSDLMKNENGNFNEKRISDMEVCELIDEQYLKSYGVKSYVELTNEQKYKIAKEIRHTYYAGYKQMIRCLAIKDID
jgi:REP element-mobilizing transposase RayT